MLSDKSICFKEYLNRGPAGFFGMNGVPLVSDDGELDAGRHIEHTNRENLEEFVELVKSKNYKKRQRSK